MTKEEMKEMVGKLTVDEILQLDDVIQSAKVVLRMFNPLFDLRHKIAKEIELNEIKKKRRKEYEERLKNNRQPVGRL